VRAELEQGVMTNIA